MRANSPLPSDFSILNPVEDELQSQEPTVEMKKLAKAAKSPDGKLILDHLNDKIEEYKNRLINTDFASYADSTVAMATVIATQKMIKEFEVVFNDVNIATQAVNDAIKQRLPKQS